MAGVYLADSDIAAMSAEDRRDLTVRLLRHNAATLTLPARRLRRRRLMLVLGATLGLPPWIAYLGITLPDRYTARNWSAVWVGFDIALFALFLATAVLGLLRRQAVALLAFATGVLLCCDAWFDVLTAGPGDHWLSLFDAAVELTVAAVLIRGAVLLIRSVGLVTGTLRPGQALWSVPILISERRDEPTQ